MAEVNKQSGRHDKAIRRYLALLSERSKIEESSHKVYSLALSFLFRLTHQYSSAATILKELVEKYPKDSEIHFQLAKVYLLRGETDRAKQHFQRANPPSLDRVATQLFFTAIGERLADSRLHDSTPLGTDIELPENRGLATCGRALSAIERAEYTLARDMIESTLYIDRLQADFGAVLRFHATKKIDKTFSFKSDQTLSRIAKRGYDELRRSVDAISDGRFDTALEIERRMCLLIA